MMVAAGFALLKLMRSFFAKTIDFHRGRSLFHQTIRAIRATSVVNNDLQWRLAELMVQMWNGARLDSNQQSFNSNDDSPIQMDDSLQLKVRCRHSMSLVFDSVWRWREDFQALGRGTIDGTYSLLLIGAALKFHIFFVTAYSRVYQQPSSQRIQTRLTSHQHHQPIWTVP